MPGPTVTRARLLPTMLEQRRAWAQLKAMAGPKGDGTFIGYVDAISTLISPETGSYDTLVYFRGQWVGHLGGTDDYVYLEFYEDPGSRPTSNPKYLPELQRAQSHPHLQVGITVDMETLTIKQLSVQLDYDRRMHATPPFDERVIVPSKAS
jgi:hypothetical protein